jgi:organic radical activating enzyme
MQKVKIGLSTVKAVKPLGSTSPWAWVLNPVDGCNLRCGHCSCRLNEIGKYNLMSEQTWADAWNIINVVTPTCRVDLCLGGEPTLHPRIVDFLRIARKLSPLAQIQITTNGTMLRSGDVTYRGLLQAGANIIYTDMYGSKEKFFDMAKESGYKWYEYYRKKESDLSPWSYWGPHLKMIVLQEQPENWPQSRYRAGLLGTWYNHLDWEAAARFGLTPVTEPIHRRCNQPFIYVPVYYDGSYLLCCQDNTGETAGLFGNVSSGVGGFREYWYGKAIQTIRRRLRQKNRADTSQCSRCCITFSRCDIKHWEDEQVAIWWDGKKWLPLD